MVLQKVLFMWSSMPIFSFIGYTLTELFRKPDNWRQIYKQTSSTSTLYASKMYREEKNISTSWQGCEIAVNSAFFVKKIRKQSQEMFCKKKCSKKFRKLHRKITVLEPFFMKWQVSSLQVFWKETPTQVLSCEVCETSKNTYSGKHLQGTASKGVLQKSCS